MSQITDVILCFCSVDKDLALRLRFGVDTEYSEWQFKDVDTENKGGGVGGNKVFCEGLVVASVNYLDREELLKVVEGAEWRAPEEVMLLVKNENDVRSGVFGFAGASYFGRVDQPRKLTCLVEAVPS